MSEQLSPFVAGLVKLQKDIKENGPIMSFKRAMDHHECGPSQAYKRVTCPGSKHMEERARAAGLSHETEEASEGTKMHLANNPAVPLDGYTEEQRLQIEKARKYIAERLQGAEEVWYEMTMNLHISPDVILTYGTCDVIGVYPNMVRVIDTKYGRSLMAPSVGDWQMMLYAAMAMQTYGVDSAEVWVYQPREDTEFVAEYSGASKIVEAYAEIIFKCKEADAPLHADPDACQFCLGKTICPAFMEEASKLPATRTALDVLSPEQIAKALDFARLVEPWAKQVRDYARQRLEAGDEVPGWTLGERTTRKVEDVNAAYDAVYDVLTQKDFLDVVEVPIGALEDAYARLYKEHEGVSLKEARARFRERIGDCVTTSTQRYLKKE
jgi:hypothetical protein